MKVTVWLEEPLALAVMRTGVFTGIGPTVKVVEAVDWPWGTVTLVRPGTMVELPDKRPTFVVASAFPLRWAVMVTTSPG